MSHEAKREDGFTLVELLVSLLLLGMLMAITYGTLNFSAKALARNINIAEHNEDIMQVETFIRKIIQNADPQNNIFSGTSTVMNFTTTMDKDGTRDKYKVSLSMENSDFILRWRRLGTSNNLSEVSINDRQGEVVLIKNIPNLKISYAARNFATTKIWQPMWNANETMPKYIKIEIVGDDFWPELMLELNVTHTIDCWYDPVSRGCQSR